MKRLLIFVITAVAVLSCSDSHNETTVSPSIEVIQMDSPAADSCAEPYLFTDQNGRVYLSWVEKKGKESRLLYAVWNTDSWSEPVMISSGKNWFVNWADYPVITADGRENIIAHYLEKSDTAKFTYDIKLISSVDSGKSWGPAKILHNDNVKAEHGFVSMTPYKEGFFVSWLDGRKTAGEESPGGHEGHHGEMTLRGAMLDAAGNKTDEWELDDRVCDCCQTSVAVTDKGPVVVYRDRSADEIRDVSVVRLVNGNWTTPKTIYPDNWNIKGCPVNGPQIAAMGNNLVIAWFTMIEKKGEVKIIFSTDGGESFGDPVRIDDGKPIGRIDVVMTDASTACVSWMEGSEIKATKIHADGKKENPVMIASSSEKRSSGFPQMTRSGNRIYFAWTDDKAKTIRTASMND